MNPLCILIKQLRTQMGNIFNKTASQILTEHEHIQILEEMCLDASDDKFRIPLILAERKDTRQKIFALFRSFSKIPLKEDMINIYWLKQELANHIQRYNECFPERFIEPSDYIKYKSETLRLAIYSLKTSVLNKEHKVKYELEVYSKPLSIMIEV